MSERGTSQPTRFVMNLGDRFGWQPLLPHDRILSIAKTGLRSPQALSEAEVQALANAMLVHYAQLGIG